MFKEEVLNNDKLVLVDFWAPWCKYCIMLEPTLEELKNKYTNFSIFKVNVDEDPDLAQEYDVMALPTLMFFKGGKALDIEVTDRSLEGLSKIVEQNI